MFFSCHRCKCMSMSNFIFSAFHGKYFHISTWSSSYLFQLLLMSNITPSETYSEYRWKFDFLKVYCSLFLTQKEFVSSFYLLSLIINMLTHNVFGNLKGKGKYIVRCLSIIVLIDIYCKLQGRVTAQCHLTFSISLIRVHEGT